MSTFSVPCPKTSALCGASQPSAKQHQQQQQCSVSFPSSSASLLTGSSLRFQGSRHNKYDVFKVSAVNEVIEKSSNSAPVPLSNSALVPLSNSAPVPETKSEELSKESACQNTVPDTASISAFMTQVGDLVKLVDSRDIMELQLKQLGCELIIRKKEALQQPASVVMMQPPSPQAMVPSQLPPVPVSAPPSVGLVPSPPVSAPAPAAKPKSSHPPLKCPMAGTFYRSPAPGAPPFVKVGDKIQKGQVVCIIEAMKLMNEIEADQSGTIVEIPAEDAKPVSVDTPLFVIEP